MSEEKNVTKINILNKHRFNNNKHQSINTHDVTKIKHSDKNRYTDNDKQEHKSEHMTNTQTDKQEMKLTS